MDIFEFAMEREKLSENYYRELAGKSTSKGLRSIFTMLADEEKKHWQVVQAMQKKTVDTVTESPVLEDAKKVFESMRQATDNFNFDISETQLYQKAVKIEEEAERYYKEKAQQVPDEKQKEIFLTLAAEEHKHFRILESICDFVARPQWFLENAEMYRFDDYAGGVL